MRAGCMSAAKSNAINEVATRAEAKPTANRSVLCGGRCISDATERAMSVSRRTALVKVAVDYGITRSVRMRHSAYFIAR